MSRSADPGHFFQTQASIADSSRKAAKAGNELGKPIKLPSKILDIVAINECFDDGDEESQRAVYVAESAGTVRRVKLESGETNLQYRGATAPLASICAIRRTLFAGCWDKAIWRWNASTGTKGGRLQGHSDFVKTLCFVPVGSRKLLVSGGADATLVVWDAESGQKLHSLKSGSRGLLGLAFDPWDSTPDAAVVFSAGSTPEIRRWRIGVDEAVEMDAQTPIVAHETSVYKLRFDADGDLWTASADKTAKCLLRDRGWKEDLVLRHPDFVKDVVVDEVGGKVITACRDEEIRVWDRATGELYHTFSGHFEEVTGLAIMGKTLVSVSIDCTIRQWPLKADELAATREAAQAELNENVSDDAPAKGQASLLTEDEENELADLMDDSG